MAGALGTPEITLFDHAPGSGVWHLEQNTSDRGPIPIAVYSGQMNLTAAKVPEPGLMWVVAVALGLILAKQNSSLLSDRN